MEENRNEKPRKHKWLRPYAYYPVYWAMLIGVFLSFANGRDTTGWYQLGLIAFGAVFDLVQTRDRGESAGNWMLLTAAAGFLLLWKFITMGEWVPAVVFGLFGAAALVGFGVLWKKGFPAEY